MSPAKTVLGSVALAMLATACGGGGAESCPKTPGDGMTTASGALVVPLPQRQREATIMVQARLPEEAKERFVKRVIDSKIIPDEWGNVGTDWSSRGSGFFIKAGPTNKVLAITNKHVVEGAITVTVKLTKNVLINDCTVLFTDDRHDLAVIALPDEMPKPILDSIHYVTLAKHPPFDNEPVSASGYPGVAGDQSYRLTPGTISNANFKFEVDGREEPYIQHTAAIDHGNSGGPLFESTSLDVLGVNTLKMRGNDSLNCAVPASTIDDVVKKALAVQDPKELKDATPAKTAINDTCKQLVQELSVGGRTPEYTASILSDAMVSDLGIDAWEKKLQALDGRGAQQQMMQRLGTNLRQGAAMTYLRPFLLAHMFDEFKALGQGECTESSLLASDLKDFDGQKQVRQRIDFSKGGFRTFYWKLEQGHWRLNKYD